MATSDNPFVVPNVVTGTHEPEDHQHDVPIVNIEEKDRETLEYEPPEVVAEEEKAILEFDEADALFGKRSGVKDSHDR
jgi:zona occludens toxin (predicted ATPase)